jgi:hypothetical protein
MHGLRKYRPVNAQTYDPLCVTTTALNIINKWLTMKGSNLRLALVSFRQIGTVLTDQEGRVRIRNGNNLNAMKTWIYIGQRSRVDLTPNIRYNISYVMFSRYI